jgi:hypothetical protein
VATLGCSVPGCYRHGEPHHLMHAEPSAMSLKSGDDWLVPLCRQHHDALHARGDERAWWSSTAPGIDPIALARALWSTSGVGMP